MTDQLTAAHDRITTAVEQLATGADWQTMLDVAARFHTYSPNNIWLILAQRPDATRVAGHHTWRNLDRWVRKREHGIAVLAPIVGDSPPPRGTCSPPLSRTQGSASSAATAPTATPTTPPEPV